MTNEELEDFRQRVVQITQDDFGNELPSDETLTQMFGREVPVEVVRGWILSAPPAPDPFSSWRRIPGTEPSSDVIPSPGMADDVTEYTAEDNKVRFKRALDSAFGSKVTDLNQGVFALVDIGNQYISLHLNPNTGVISTAFGISPDKKDQLEESDKYTQAGWDFSAKSLQKGTLEFARGLKKFLSAARFEGLGISYLATEKRADVYEKQLTKAGFKKTSDFDYGDARQFQWSSAQDVQLVEDEPEKMAAGGEVQDDPFQNAAPGEKDKIDAKLQPGEVVVPKDDVAAMRSLLTEAAPDWKPDWLESAGAADVPRMEDAPKSGVEIARSLGDAQGMAAGGEAEEGRRLQIRHDQQTGTRTINVGDKEAGSISLGDPNETNFDLAKRMFPDVYDLNQTYSDKSELSGIETVDQVNAELDKIAQQYGLASAKDDGFSALYRSLDAATKSRIDSLEIHGSELENPGDYPGKPKVGRINGIMVDPEFQGTGLGQMLYLQGFDKGGSDWYYNSQTYAPATNTLKAMKEKGYIDLHWHGNTPRYGEEGGAHIAKITGRGRDAYKSMEMVDRKKLAKMAGGGEAKSPLVAPSPSNPLAGFLGQGSVPSGPPPWELSGPEDPAAAQWGAAAKWHASFLADASSPGAPAMASASGFPFELGNVETDMEDPYLPGAEINESDFGATFGIHPDFSPTDIGGNGTMLSPPHSGGTTGAMRGSRSRQKTMSMTSAPAASSGSLAGMIGGAGEMADVLGGPAGGEGGIGSNQELIDAIRDLTEAVKNLTAKMDNKPDAAAIGPEAYLAAQAAKAGHAQAADVPSFGHSASPDYSALHQAINMTIARNSR